MPSYDLVYRTQGVTYGRDAPSWRVQVILGFNQALPETVFIHWDGATVMPFPLMLLQAANDGQLASYMGHSAWPVHQMGHFITLRFADEMDEPHLRLEVESVREFLEQTNQALA